MNIQEFRTELSNKYPQERYIRELRELADNNIGVESSIEAYDFDLIKNDMCKKQSLRSADAMLVANKCVYLIEFKTGFSGESFGFDCNDMDRNKKEILKLSIRLKACESLIMLEKVLCKDGYADFRKGYISVIDCYEDPKGSRSDIFCLKSASDESYSDKSELYKSLTETSLLIYRKSTNGKQIMYDSVEVLYDSEFDGYIDRIMNNCQM